MCPTRAAPLIPEVISGQIDSAVLGVPVIEQHVKSGKLKAWPFHQKHVAWPCLTCLRSGSWREGTLTPCFNIGLVAPAGTPAAIVEKSPPTCAAS